MVRLIIIKAAAISCGVVSKMNQGSDQSLVVIISVVSAGWSVGRVECWQGSEVPRNRRI